jgi:hypothetical protein
VVSEMEKGNDGDVGMRWRCEGYGDGMGDGNG